MKNKSFYVVYKTTNLVNNNIYIGVHKTNDTELDKYYGSGIYYKNAETKYGKCNFKREILYLYHSPKVAYAREKYIVNSDFILREDTYNLKLGGKGGFDACNKPEIQLKAISSRKLNGTDTCKQMITSTSLEKAKLTRKINGTDRCKQLLTTESRTKMLSTKQNLSYIRCPRLKERILFLSPDNTLILNGTLAELGILLHKNASKHYTTLLNYLDKGKSITKGKWKNYKIKSVHMH